MSRLIAIAGVLCLGGCVEAPPAPDPPGSVPELRAETPPEATSAAYRAPEVAPEPRPTFEPPTTGERIRIEAGTLLVGSAPGRVGRRPSVEADLTPVDVPGFDIDRLPYPNDPDRPAQLTSTRAEAEQMCDADGRRLCRELEWERACRGDGADEFATGPDLDLATCVDDPAACASPLGVLDLGFRAPEWTASDAEPRLARLERTAVVRGARPDSTLAAHRCGTRHVKDPRGGGRALAFRCCGGDAPSPSYPDVGLRRVFRDLELEPQRWREILAGVPELARFAEGFEPFGETTALRALARGHASEADVPWELTRGPFAWSPSPGEEVYVVSGRSEQVSLLVTLYPMPDGTFRHAASFVFAEEEAPIAILRTRSMRHELLWTTCWSCGGENGVVRFGEDSRIVIAQR